MNEASDQEEDDSHEDIRPRDEISLSEVFTGSSPPSGNPINEISSSPIGSHDSRSTSSRRSDRMRVVELLQNNDEASESSNRGNNWMIGEGFYHEDVAADDVADEDDYSDIIDDDSDDDQDEDEDEENLDEHIHDSDDTNSTNEEDAGVDADDLGFVMAPDENDLVADISGDEESDNDGNENVIHYDLSIPTEHRYLGDNREESRGRRVLLENTTVTLPLFNIKGIVLLPGQVLPITTEHSPPRIQMLLLSCINRGECLVGLVSNPRTNQYGTTAEIRSYTRNDTEILSVIMEGRQRFKLLSQPFEVAIDGAIKILPEIYLGRPYNVASSWKRLLVNDDISTKFIVSRHPKQLLRNHEARCIMRNIMELIVNWCVKAPIGDPNAFSYWLATNLPINNQKRIEVLKLDCTEARLIWLSSLLIQNEALGCSRCGSQICEMKHIFLMSYTGPQNSFVNSGGFIHDTLTVSKAEHLIYQDRGWLSEYSWFPGYAWKIGYCEGCTAHIGWCYKSTQPDTKPKKFWGLSRENVRLIERENERPVIGP